MSKKTTKEVTARTLEDVERLMATVAAADAAARKITAQMDQELHRVREKYSAALDAEAKRRADAEEEIASWAELNRAAFGSKRSLELTHGTVGWRLGNPTVACRLRVKVAAALELVRARMPEFVRTAEELDKAAILSAYTARAVTDEELATVGLRITQTERFYVEPKTEEVTDGRA